MATSPVTFKVGDTVAFKNSRFPRPCIIVRQHAGMWCLTDEFGSPNAGGAWDNDLVLLKAA